MGGMTYAEESLFGGVTTYYYRMLVMLEAAGCVFEKYSEQKFVTDKSFSAAYTSPARRHTSEITQHQRYFTIYTTDSHKLTTPLVYDNVLPQSQ